MYLNAEQTSFKNFQKLYQNFSNIIKFQPKGFVTDHKTIWQHNNTRLLKFPEKNNSPYKSAILFIPSLLNQGYILDIMSGYSLIEFMTQQKEDCFCIDWGEPLSQESEYTIVDYYNKKIIKIIDVLLYCKNYKNLILVGHCFGGILGTITAILNKDHIKGIALIATPFDFSYYAKEIDSHSFLFNYVQQNFTLISSLFINNLFCLLTSFDKKYSKFMHFINSTDYKQRELFMRVEKWSLDNLSMTRGVFKEIINDFIVNNMLIKNKLYLNKININLNALENIPCFYAASHRDTIVPKQSSEYILKYIKHKKINLSNSGHIGMILGKNAKKELWFPLFNWISSLK